MEFVKASNVNKVKMSFITKTLCVLAYAGLTPQWYDSLKKSINSLKTDIYLFICNLSVADSLFKTVVLSS